jgi:hypothetical protein
MAEADLQPDVHTFAALTATLARAGTPPPTSLLIFVGFFSQYIFIYMCRVMCVVCVVVSCGQGTSRTCSGCTI